MTKKLLTEKEQDEFLKKFFNDDEEEEVVPKLIEPPKKKVQSEFTIETREFLIEKENEKNKFLLQIDKTK